MDNAIFDKLENRFTSANDVPVGRAHVNAAEWQLLQQFRSNVTDEFSQLAQKVQQLEEQNSSMISTISSLNRLLAVVQSPLRNRNSK